MFSRHQVCNILFGFVLISRNIGFYDSFFPKNNLVKCLCKKTKAWKSETAVVRACYYTMLAFFIRNFTLKYVFLTSFKSFSNFRLKSACSNITNFDIIKNIATGHLQIVTKLLKWCPRSYAQSQLCTSLLLTIPNPRQRGGGVFRTLQSMVGQ